MKETLETAKESVQRFELWRILKYSELDFDPLREYTCFLYSELFELELQEGGNDKFSMHLQVQGESNATRLLDEDLKYCRIYYNYNIKDGFLQIFIEYSEDSENPQYLKSKTFAYKLNKKR